MIRVRLLGPIQIERDGTVVPGLECYPKKMIFLGYLATQPQERFITRDQLISLFWAESAEKQARHALSQMLHSLRQTLGPDAIEARGAQLLRLNPASNVDVRDFEKAVAKNDHISASACYRGELLQDVIISNDPELSDWVDRERQRFRVRAARSLWQAAFCTLERNELEAALRAAKKAIECDPASESECYQFASRSLVVNRPEIAADILSHFAFYLKHTLDEMPTVEFTKLAETVALSARAPAAAPLSALQGRSYAPRQARIVKSSSPASIARRKRFSYAIAGIGVVGVLAILGRSIAVRSLSSSGLNEEMIHLVVPNFEVEDHDVRLLAERALDKTLTKLGSATNLRITAGNNDVHNAVLAKSYRLVAKFLVDGDSTSVTSKLIGPSSRLILALTAFRVPDDSASVDRNAMIIADRIVANVGQALAKESRILSRDRDVWSRAYGNHLLADSLRVAGALDEAIKRYAVADSLYSRGFQTQEGRTVAGLSRVTLAATAAITATMRGYNGLADSIFRAGDEIASRLVKKNPANAEFLEARGILRYRHWMLAPSPAHGLLNGAREDLNAAIKIQPFRSAAMVGLSGVHFAQGDYAASSAIARRALEADAFLVNNEEILSRLFLSTFNLAEDSAAIHWCYELNRRLPKRWPSATCRLMVMAWSSRAHPDVSEADQILLRGIADEAPYKKKRLLPRLEALRAAVVARAGREAEARAILDRLDENSDSELLGLEAAVLLQLGDRHRAADLLSRYERVGPGAATQLRTGRIFRSRPNELNGKS